MSSSKGSAAGPRATGLKGEDSEGAERDTRGTEDGSRPSDEEAEEEEEEDDDVVDVTLAALPRSGRSRTSLRDIDPSKGNVRSLSQEFPDMAIGWNICDECGQAVSVEVPHPLAKPREKWNCRMNTWNVAMAQCCSESQWNAQFEEFVRGRHRVPRPWIIQGKTINKWWLYNSVTQMGGWETVKYNGWLPLLYEEIGITASDAGYRLRRIYETELLGFEQRCFKGKRYATPEERAKLFRDMSAAPTRKPPGVDRRRRTPAALPTDFAESSHTPPLKRSKGAFSWQTGEREFPTLGAGGLPSPGEPLDCCGGLMPLPGNPIWIPEGEVVTHADGGVSVDSAEYGAVFAIERLLGHTVTSDGEVYFRVQWKGGGEAQATWEQEWDLMETAGPLVDHYWCVHREYHAPPPR
jgi:hypothetical protein